MTLSTELTDLQIQDALRQFIVNDLLLGQVAEIKDDDDLLLSGLMDSLGVVRLIAFIESELHLTVPPEDVVLENFQTLAAITAYLQNRKTV
jgi:acyl carrier protein